VGVKVKIFGREYNLKANEKEEYLREIASFVDRRIKKIALALPQRENEEMSVLACLNIADELYRLKDRNKKARNKIRLLIEKMEKLSQ